MTAVYLDVLGPDNALPDPLKLHPVRLEQWNGFAVPVTTADEFRRYVTAWHHYGKAERCPLYLLFHPDDVVIEADGALIYRSPSTDQEDEYWSVIGVHDGTPVYALDGWQWVA